MKVFASDQHVVDLPPGHRFPMGKYRVLREALVAEGVLRAGEILPAPAATREELERVHDPAYVAAVLDGTLDARAQRRIGLPWSPALVARSSASAGGTVAAARAALVDGLAGNLAGGTHHAHRAYGSGFCVWNDLAVASAAMLAEGRVARVLVFDVDVHQGDGTAAIFAGDPRVQTCSLHGARNFPFEKQESDLDLPLADGAGDDEVLAAVERALAHFAALAPPDLVLYQGGVDALATDTLGRLRMTHAGLVERDRLALGHFRRRGIPIVVTLGGGYAKPIEDTIAAHVNTYRVAAALARA
ncbi:MAG TPA: histone deacetylase [Kofleriaceae bacterium]|nr:histone deacetylase [Kofleriaceae bacterium]